MRRYLGFTRFIAELGVLSSLLLSAVLYVAATARTVTLVYQQLPNLGSQKAVKTLLVAGVEQADVLLIATALLIVGIGLHALFVGKLDRMPPWLDIRSFDDLKDKLVNVVVVALAVNFFSVVVASREGVLPQGLSVGAVVLAFAAFNWVRGGGHKNGAPEDA